MRHSVSVLACAILIAMGAPLAAQDTAAPDQATPDQAGSEAPGPEAPADGADLNLDMGVDPTAAAAPAEPQAGQFYIRAEFGDWGLRCMYMPDQPDPCELYQLLLGPDDNPVAEFSVFPLANGGQAVAGATIVAPLETLLTEGITIAVDGGAARQYQFSYCNRAGCVARIGLTANDLAAFKAGARAQMRIVPAAAPDQPFDLTISLSGFTAGMDGSTAYDPDAPNEEGIPGATPPAEAQAEAPAGGGN